MFSTEPKTAARLPTTAELKTLMPLAQAWTRQKLAAMQDPVRMLWLGLLFLSALITFGLAAGQMPLGFVVASLVIMLAAIMAIGYFVYVEPLTQVDGGARPADLIVAALIEPAVLAEADGRILAANAAWRDAGGPMMRLPRDTLAPALFIAMSEARTRGLGRVLMRLGGHDFEMVISRLGEDQYLIRAASEGVLGTSLLLDYVPEPRLDARGDKPSPDTKPDETQDEDGPLPQALDSFARLAPFGAALLDAGPVLNAQIHEVNPAFLRLALPPRTTLGEATTLRDLIDIQWLDDVQNRLEAGQTGPLELRLTCDPERPVHLYVTSAGDGEDQVQAVYLFDITAQKQLELNLSQAQKMQAIGQLAGGVAHDFNNLLTALNLRLDELLARHPVGDPSYEGLNEIRQTGLRAADLVRKLLAFSRKQTVKRMTLNLGELISESEVLLRRLMREDVRLETAYGRDLPLIHVDRSQIETAVINLAVNARDAVHAHGGGSVTINTRGLSQTEARTLGWAECPQAGAALIEVSDTGPGVPPELAAKIFEPFFTTKPVGEGTGMGLATVYGIVQQADGHIALDSRLGEGARFRIFLPVREEQAEAEAAKTAPAAPPQKPVARDLSGAGRILFVEDEDMVRGIAAKLLRARGYEVIEACDGEEALILAEEYAGRIDMLISDVIMPGLDGPSLLKKARPFLNGAPVMFISGYAEAEFSDMLDGESGISFLPKPLDIKTLAERVKDALQPHAA